MTERLHAELGQQLLARLPDAGHDLPPEQWTIGVEHELILLGRDGLPSTHAESQALLQAFAGATDSRVTFAETPVGEMITRATQSVPSGGRAALKYDHHPHVMEIELPPVANLHALAGDIEAVLTRVAALVSNLGFRIAEAVIDIDPLHPRVTSPLPEFEGLRHYRRVVQLRRGAASTGACNYAALIAATQTHVGGVRWWRNPDFLRRCYLLECVTETFGYEAVDTTPHARWALYEEVFRGYPLCGFPSLADWGFDEYVAALLHSPLAGRSDETWTGATLATLGAAPRGSWDLFFDRVRDFPVIRPRRFGTVEFRSDPSQPTAATIVRCAAVRLAQAQIAFADPGRDDRPLRVAAEGWWRARAVREPRPLPASHELLEKLRSALRSRGHGEEIYVRTKDDA